MTPTPTWTINTLDRSLPDGIVTTIHWSVSLAEDGFSASAYGTVGLEPPVPDDCIPYQALFPDLVMQWLTMALGADLVTAHEASLAARIEEQRNPKQATGLPWSALTQPSDDTTEPLTPDAT